MGVSSGKWYFEVLAKDYAAGGGTCFGIAEKTYITSHASPPNFPLVGDCIGTDTYYGPKRGDDWADNGAYADIGTDIFADGDILQIAFDMDAGKFWAGKNNTWFDSGDPAAGTGNMDETFPTYTPLVPSMARGGSYDEEYIFNFGQDSSFAGEKTAQGNQDSGSIGDFYYEPPSGFKAICSSNFAAPEIADPTDHFNTKLYTGNGTAIGSGGQVITGVGFQPDFVWIKQRSSSAGTEPPTVTDAVRGATKYLETSNAAMEATDVEMVNTFDSDGFTIGDQNRVNESTDPYVSWNWKGDGVSGGTLNQDGDIDSYVNVNTTAGFSIVKYVGTGTAGDTVGHGLSSTPEIIFVKNRDTGGNWMGGVTVVGWDYNMVLETTNYKELGTSFWNDTAPSASVFTLGTNAAGNQSTKNIIAYCFHSVEGYSKMGGYTGNGDDDGPFVYTGFRPSYILIKRYDSANGWIIQDDARSPYNTVKAWLYADDNANEYTGWTGLDMNSNGFKPRDGAANTMNASGGDYLYMAFAQTPFKTANAR